MTAHTPGPWKVVAIDWSSDTGWARFEVEGIRVTGMADARPIAAAPELLEALQKLVSAATLSAAQGVPFVTDSPGIVRARAAIAKATGASA